MTTLALLWWLVLDAHEATHSGTVNARWPSTLPMVALMLLALQIALGGWTSSNYAALACTDFPTCHGGLWPEMDFREAFVLWRGLGINYEYGVLDAPARTAIHMTHRIGAVVAAIAILALALRCLKAREVVLVRAAKVLLLALVAQLALGISNVVFSLPIAVAVAHNAVAALLLLSVVTVLYFSRRPARKAS